MKQRRVIAVIGLGRHCSAIVRFLRQNGFAVRVFERASAAQIKRNELVEELESLGAIQYALMVRAFRRFYPMSLCVCSARESPRVLDSRCAFAP